MKITNYEVIEGEHNGYPFILRDGFLEMYGRRFSKKEIKTLTELEYLLRLEGHEVKETLPKFRASLFG